MKKIIVFGLMIFINQQIIAQGISFESDINQVFAKAKELNKPVMIECYHPNCPVCMALEPTLKEKEAGDYYNQFFVSYKLNLSDQNQVKFLTERKLYLPSFPMLLYFDSEKNIIHNAEPQNSVSSLIEIGQKAKSPQLQSIGLKKRYENGEKNIEILFGIGQFSRITLDTALNKKAMIDLFNIYPKEALGTEESWAITQKCVTDINNGFATYWFNHITEAAIICKKQGHPDTEKNALSAIIQANLFSPQAKNFKMENVKKIQDYMTKVGAGEYVEANTWQATVYAAENDKTPLIGKNILTKITNKFKANPQALIFIAKFINEEVKTLNYQDEAKIALSNAEKLITEKDYAIKSEFYFENAQIAKKDNNSILAQKHAVSALKNAQLAKVDTKKFLDLQDAVK